MILGQVELTRRRSFRVVSVPANTVVELAAANPNRLTLELMNIDVGRVTLGFNAEPAANAGPALAAASGVGEQGGAWFSGWVPETGVVYGRAGAVATRVAVVEG